MATILVVEDERIVTEDIREALQQLGYEVPAMASSGTQAISAAAKVGPELVLMDVRLRGSMDGIEAAERICRDLNVPVVFLTAYADDRTLERAKRTGPYGYLVKPFNERELRSTIEVALYKHGVETQLRDLHAQLE
ncbi:MAG: response regulator, partial [Candidatus Latescibacterota bacterium]